MLREIADKQSVDLGQLTLENSQPQRGKYFDPEREIAEEDWQIICNQVRGLVEYDAGSQNISRLYHNFYWDAPKIAELCPKRRPQLGLTDELFKFMRDQLVNRLNLTEIPAGSYILDWLYAIKQLFPGRMPVLLIDQKISTQLAEHLTGTLFSGKLVKATVVCPEVVEEYGIKEFHRNSLISELNHKRNLSLLEEDSVERLLSLGAEVRLIYGDACPETRPDNPAWLWAEKYWKEMYKSWQEKKGIGVSREFLINDAYYLKICRAEKAWIENGDIKIENGCSNTGKLPEMPLSKKISRCKLWLKATKILKKSSSRNRK